MKLETTINLNTRFGEVTVQVSGVYYTGIRGSRSSLGVPEEPDDDDYIEVSEPLTVSGDGIQGFNASIEALAKIAGITEAALIDELEAALIEELGCDFDPMF